MKNRLINSIYKLCKHDSNPVNLVVCQESIGYHFPPIIFGHGMGKK